MSTQEDWVIVGRFGRPHGIKGFVSVYSFTEPNDNILSYSDWHVFLNSQWQAIKLLSVEVHNKAIVAQIEGFPERESVQREAGPSDRAWRGRRRRRFHTESYA